MQIIEALTALGLNDKQAKVYLALLALGTAPAYSIADKSGLKRPTTYVILDELIHKGMVFQIPRSRKKIYKAKSPDEIFSEIENRITLAKTMLPDLNALARGEKDEPRVIYYEGLNGVQEALNYKLDQMAGKEFLAFAAKTNNELLQKFNQYLEYNQRLKDLGIRTRGIAPKDPSLESFRNQDELFNRNFKTVLPEVYSSDIAVIVGDTFMIYFDPKNLQSVVIDNKDIAETTRQIFEMIWHKY